MHQDFISGVSLTSARLSSAEEKISAKKQMIFLNGAVGDDVITSSLLCAVGCRDCKNIIQHKMTPNLSATVRYSALNIYPSAC